MSQEAASQAAKLIAGLARIAKLAETVPEEILAAWLHYDAGLSKTQAKNVSQSIKRLLKILGEE